MPARPVLYAVAGLTLAALAISVAARGHAPENLSEWLAPIGPAVTVAGAGVWAFDKWAWRWPGITKLHGRPVLDGTWHGELASQWINPETEQPVPPDPDVFLVIRQRFWQVSARLITHESKSESLMGDFERAPDGVHRLIYVYSNTPRAEFRFRSNIHLGGVVLNVPAHRDAGLEGEYFTDRSTSGHLTFFTYFKRHIDTHSQGLELVRQADQ